MQVIGMRPKPAIRAQYKEKRRRSATRSPSHLLSALSCRLSPLLLGRVGCLGLLILIVLTSGYYCETGGSRTHHFRSPTTTTRPGFNTHHGSPCGVPTECLERLNLPLVSPSLMLARPGDFPPISVVERRILSTPPKGATVLSARGSKLEHHIESPLLTGLTVQEEAPDLSIGGSLDRPIPTGLSARGARPLVRLLRPNGPLLGFRSREGLGTAWHSTRISPSRSPRE